MSGLISPLAWVIAASQASLRLSSQAIGAGFLAQDIQAGKRPGDQALQLSRRGRKPSDLNSRLLRSQRQSDQTFRRRAFAYPKGRE